ncbi:HTH domain-containing protein [Lewinella sp. 4G2]|uniref:HTH domain-containing protein n=1 Tax=Lewinella sp. 4G2 TaxID=1803372 RepID=UPI0007B47811|nr:HTH domain-containing protein [Lewinella sp. 4G2]OAV43229.1 hypothetical protein A3850_001385 [Lewinella sp. 4G2]
MRILLPYQRLLRLHKLISRGATGSPVELARKMGVSRATIFRMLAMLKDSGAPIAYCKNQQRYYYESPFELSMVA